MYTSRKPLGLSLKQVFAVTDMLKEAVSLQNFNSSI